MQPVTTIGSAFRPISVGGWEEAGECGRPLAVHNHPQTSAEIRGKCALLPPRFQGKYSCLGAMLSASSGEGGKGTERFATCQTHKATFFSPNSPQIRDDSLQFASF